MINSVRFRVGERNSLIAQLMSKENANYHTFDDCQSNEGKKAEINHIFHSNYQKISL